MRRIGLLAGLATTILLVAQTGLSRAELPKAAPTGLAAADLLPPLAAHPAGGNDPPTNAFRLVVPAPGIEDLEQFLRNAGASSDDASLVKAAVEREISVAFAQGGDLQLSLAIRPGVKNGHEIQSIAVLNDLGRHELVRKGNNYEAPGSSIRVKRFDVSGEPYWSARRAGLDGAESDLLSRQLAHVGVYSRAHFVVGERPDRFDDRSIPRVIYVAAEGASGKREYLRTDSSGSGWVEIGSTTTEQFMRPARGRITSSFGWRRHPILGFARRHQGIDVAAPFGEPIYAAADGVVSGAGWRGGYGRQVRIAHGRATETTYSHLSRLLVAPGERISKGEVIGLAGASGLATGSHLHFEVIRNGAAVDPMSASLGVSSNPASDPIIASRLRLIRTARAA